MENGKYICVLTIEAHNHINFHSIQNPVKSNVKLVQNNKKSHTCEVGGAQPPNGAISALLPHLWSKRSKFLKNQNSTSWKYYCFALVHQKSQSYLSPVVPQIHCG